MIMIDGSCPECGSTLNYIGKFKDTGRDVGYYQVECSICDMTGKEWWKLCYDNTEVDGRSTNDIS